MEPEQETEQDTEPEKLNNHLLIQQATSLFDLLPCRTIELQIAGDWLEDRGLHPFIADGVRQGKWRYFCVMYTKTISGEKPVCYGFGSGIVDFTPLEFERRFESGNGHGTGSGNANDYARGSGYGRGDGEGRGIGYGNVYGRGDGNGSGYGQFL